MRTGSALFFPQLLIARPSFAFVAGVVLYPVFIGLLVRFGARQHVASYSPASHRAKEGTPTLGGLLFCLVVLVAWVAVDRTREGFVAIASHGCTAIFDARRNRCD